MDETCNDCRSRRVGPCPQGHCVSRAQREIGTPGQARHRETGETGGETTRLHPQRHGARAAHEPLDDDRRHHSRPDQPDLSPHRARHRELPVPARVHRPGRQHRRTGLAREGRVQFAPGAESRRFHHGHRPGRSPAPAACVRKQREDRHGEPRFRRRAVSTRHRRRCVGDHRGGSSSQRSRPSDDRTPGWAVKPVDDAHQDGGFPPPAPSCPTSRPPSSVPAR